VSFLLKQNANGNCGRKILSEVVTKIMRGGGVGVVVTNSVKAISDVSEKMNIESFTLR